MPDAETIWLYREQLTRAGAIDRLFERFDALLRERGFLAMGGQIVDATVIEARRPRLNGAEKETIKCIGLDMIGQSSDLGVRLRASDRSAQQAAATGWLC